MGFFNELSESIVNTTKDLGKSVQTTGDVAKLQYDKKAKENELEKLYTALGKKYFEAHKNDEEEDIAEINAKIARIKEINDEIMIKKGGRACPKCGAMVKDGAKFCSACGQKIDTIFEEETDEQEG